MKSMTPNKFDLLRRLALRPMTAVDFERYEEVKSLQQLVKLGYARDYANQLGKRVPVRLRIWGITDAGRAVLEMQVIGESQSKGTQGQLGFLLGRKESLTVKPCVVRTHTQIERKKSSLSKKTLEKEK